MKTTVRNSFPEVDLFCLVLRSVLTFALKKVFYEKTDSVQTERKFSSLFI